MVALTSVNFRGEHSGIPKSLSTNNIVLHIFEMFTTISQSESWEKTVQSFMMI